MNARADVIVVSQTPTEALVREWTEHTIQHEVRFIAGQELGTKTEHLQFAAHGKYPPGKILMIGDAPGDFNAAKANGACFFPINPGNEESSWKRLHDEALDRFFSGTFAGEYQSALLKEFNDCLPENPSWKT
jgi:phosphoglycolate phosphatase-like HAD superfamily hydrolase